MKKIEVELYSEAINAPVMKISSRAFPGILIQGDTLSILLHHARVLKGYTERTTTEDDVIESAEELFTKIENFVKIYEETLERHEIKMPYAKSIPE